MPVGRIEFLYLGPMTFEEFLEAKNEIYLLNQIKNITQFDLITNELHQLGLALLREYLFIGGMPEAIQTSLDLGIHEVEKVHHQILATYSADFIKYTKKSHLLKIQKVFQYLYTNNLKKIKYTNISREDHSKDISQNLKLLFMAQIAYPVTHSNCNGIPLLAGEKEKVFKNLVLDVGLLSSINRTFWPTFKNTTDDKLMTEGVMAEQFVGQHLLFSADSFREPKLNYWLREGKSDNAEIDFVLEYQNFLVAFEVKSGAAGKLRSLHQWASTTTSNNKKMIRFNTTKGALETINHMDYKYELLTLPLYMVQQWSRLLLFHSKNKLNLDLGRENE
jgi:predicted AAA+ superfamily ATPase